MSPSILHLIVREAQGQETKDPWKGWGQGLSDHTGGKWVSSLNRADCCSGDGSKGWHLEGVKWFLKRKSVHPQDTSSFLIALVRGELFSVPV